MTDNYKSENRLLRSKTVAWLAMCIMVLIIFLTFAIRPAWWFFFDEFFGFMMVFCQLVAVYTIGLNAYVAKRLQLFAAWFGILAIIALIGEFIVYQCITF